MPPYLGYMTAAYMILWAAILVYFLRLSQREKAIWEELQALRGILSRGENTEQSK
ncbi:MAG: CcmD family protein [bacterium]|nr:CcmD family protein [bacterium]